MVKLTRDPKTGAWKSRKVIPADVREAYGKANETPTWDASLTGPQAKAAYAAWLAGVEARIERLRRIATATPVGLTNRELHALAAKWYRDQVRTYEDDPGDVNGWEAAFHQIEAEDEGEAYAAHMRGEHYDGPIKRIPWVENQMEALLEGEGLVLDARTRDALSEQLHNSYARLCTLMMRRAAGDYGPDEYASSLPDWNGTAIAKPATPAAVGLTDLFEKYVTERKPAASTVKAWRRQVAHLKDYLGHDDADRVTPADIVAWKDALLAPDAKGARRAARTVRDTYLAVAKTLLGYGVENKLLPANPAAGVTVRAPKTVVLRDRGFTVDEAMAQAIFRDWFVDFGPVRRKLAGATDPVEIMGGVTFEALPAAELAKAFPSELRDDDTAWEEAPFLSLARMISGGTPKTDRLDYWNGSIAWASAKDVSQCDAAFLVETERAITSVGLAESSTKVVPKYSTVVVARGATTGRFCMFGRDIAMNQTCYGLQSRTDTPFWLNCAFRTMVSDLVQSAHGSVFDTITTATFENARLARPSDEALRAFETLVTPIFERVLLAIEESRTLAETRDYLLPRLMSGEVRVAGAAREAVA